MLNRTHMKIEVSPHAGGATIQGVQCPGANRQTSGAYVMGPKNMFFITFTLRHVSNCSPAGWLLKLIDKAIDEERNGKMVRSYWL